MFFLLGNAALLSSPGLSGARGWLKRPRRQRTYLSTTKMVDGLYVPAFSVAGRYEDDFRPTMLMDETGRLADGVAEDLLASRHSWRSGAVE